MASRQLRDAGKSLMPSQAVQCDEASFCACVVTCCMSDACGLGLLMCQQSSPQLPEFVPTITARYVSLLHKCYIDAYGTARMSKLWYTKTGSMSKLQNTHTALPADFGSLAGTICSRPLPFVVRSA